jgi:hypothetical protein
MLEGVFYSFKVDCDGNIYYYFVTDEEHLKYEITELAKSNYGQDDLHIRELTELDEWEIINHFGQEIPLGKLIEEEGENLDYGMIGYSA